MGADIGKTMQVAIAGMAEQYRLVEKARENGVGNELVLQAEQVSVSGILPSAGEYFLFGVLEQDWVGIESGVEGGGAADVGVNE